MNPKSFLLLCGGMTLACGLILAFVLMAVGTKSKRPIHHKGAKTRIQQESAPHQARPNQSRLRPKRNSARPTEAIPARSPSNLAKAPTPTIESETLPPTAATKATTAAPVPLKPNQKTMQQLSTLKNELHRELQALKKDRSSMLGELAKSLIALPPKEIALKLSILDDQSVTTVLRQFPTELRNQVLDRIDSKRAKKINRRLK